MGFLIPATEVATFTQIHPSQISSFPSYVSDVTFRNQDSFSCRRPYRHWRRQGTIARMVDKPGRSDKDSDALTSFVQKVVDTTTLPTPLISPSLAIAYPLLLIAGFLTLPLPTASLLLIFFVAYSYFGRQFVLNDYLEEQETSERDDDADDDDGESRPRTDLLAFGSAVLSTALFAPDTKTTSLMDTNDPLTILVLGLAAIVAISLLLGESDSVERIGASTMEEDLMSLWDRQLDEQGDDKNQNEKRR
jgi:hypothetical protein